MDIAKKLPSQANLIPDCSAQIIEQIRTLPFSQEQIFQIKLSLEEALANAVVHGNRSEPDKTVEVSLRILDEALELTVLSQGEGFDFRKIDDPTLECNLKKVHGRGIFLIKANMDKIDFFDEGRGLKMVKFFR